MYRRLPTCLAICILTLLAVFNICTLLVGFWPGVIYSIYVCWVCWLNAETREIFNRGGV